MGVGVDAFGIYALRLDGGRGKSGAGGIDFFKQGASGKAADDIAKAGAAVKVRFSNTVLKYGDHRDLHSFPTRRSSDLKKSIPPAPLLPRPPSRRSA